MANEAFADSQRTTVLKTLVSSFQVVHNARYYVRRGPVNWASFDFTTHPYAVSILCDETSFLRLGPQTMVLSVEIMMKMKPENELSKNNVDDTGLEELVNDVQIVCAELESKMQSGYFAGDLDNVVLKLDKERDRLVEISDVTQGIQGIWAQFVVDY